MKDKIPKRISPMASRSAPQMEQEAAINAKAYHIIPLTIGNKIYLVETLALANGAGQAHEVVCKSTDNKEIWRTRIFENNFDVTLETDVQEVFVVDLYLKENEVVVKLEYRKPIFVNASNGQLVDS